MQDEILINVTAREGRAAVVQNGVLQEVIIERASRGGVIGNIYKGRVARVLPGMQAAFIDIGLQRTGFLHASDIAPPAGRAEGETPGIRELLREGQEVIVQVMKEAIGGKGARLTTFITIPARYLVFMPSGDGIGISSRIDDESERDRLRTAMAGLAAESEPAGYIVRTAAEGAPADALRADLKFLRKLWGSIQAQAASQPAGSVIHEDLPLAIRVMRDLVNPGIGRVQVDHEESFQALKQFAARFIPQLEPIVEFYQGPRPIFDLYGVDDEIQKALQRKVELKSGGSLVIDQTEAMTTVDVNTGGYVGHRNLEDTIFRTNLEAALAIARQLRLRNLGGIIIIDFIDMEQELHRRQVLDALSGALAQDSARTQITQVSPLGLVEMTRKRTRDSLEHLMCQPCPACKGRGRVKSPETVCYEIFREIMRQHRQFSFNELVVLAHEDVIGMLLDEEAGSVAELEELTGKPIRLQTEALHSYDQFDVVLV
jgi:ribonuclease G